MNDEHDIVRHVDLVALATFLAQNRLYGHEKALDMWKLYKTNLS